MKGKIMKKMMSLSIVAFFAASVVAAENTLVEVRERGYLICGVDLGVPGFSEETDGLVAGFDADICRSISAAIFGTPSVEFVSHNNIDRYTSLMTGTIDVQMHSPDFGVGHSAGLIEVVSWTHYDGIFVGAPEEFGVSSLRDLDGASFCTVGDNRVRRTLSAYLDNNQMEHSFRGLSLNKSGEFEDYDLRSECEVVAAERMVLLGFRTSAKRPFTILPEALATVPFGIGVSRDDAQWSQIVSSVFNALLIAEELGISSATIDEDIENTNNSRILGGNEEFAAALGLDSGWAKNAIRASGNYGEIFDRNLGENSEVGSWRGLNAQWTSGGILIGHGFH